MVVTEAVARRNASQAHYDWKRAGKKVPVTRLRQRYTREAAIAAWMDYARVNRHAAEKAVKALWAERRITIHRADRWCIALGTHLAIVYPEVYYR